MMGNRELEVDETSLKAGRFVHVTMSPWLHDGDGSDPSKDYRHVNTKTAVDQDFLFEVLI